METEVIPQRYIVLQCDTKPNVLNSYDFTITNEQDSMSTIETFKIYFH